MTTKHPKAAVLLVNLGSPDEATPQATSRWLIEFLSDPDVVELPRWFWLPLLRFIIAPKRANRLAQLYSSIWTERGSPLVAITRQQARALEAVLVERGYAVPVYTAMRYGTPALGSELKRLGQDYASVTLLLQYPQFANSTSGSSLKIIKLATEANRVMSVRVIDSFPVDPAYIGALGRRIEEYWQANGRGDHLLVSFHGLPEQTIKRGDPYQRHCEQTMAALVTALELNPDDYTLCYQSRFGAARWIGPATVDVADKLAASGTGRLDVVCPGFPADCLETLEEIKVQLRDRFLAAGGGDFHYIPALNDSSHWISAMADMVEPLLQEKQND
ncbi:MAG: ferrochelatase [Immundisolibacteraceae bacterium]|nr:ferrochelatase [Immundisolibacteraceae bacterium]